MIGATLNLRPATPEDREFAYLVRREAFRASSETIRPWDEEAERRLHVERFERLEFRIVEWEGCDVGVMAMSLDAEALNLHQLFLRPEDQGRGIGERCMRRLMEEARGPIRLRVIKTNPRAAAFYRRLGFWEVGETETHLRFEWSR